LVSLVRLGRFETSLEKPALEASIYLGGNQGISIIVRSLSIAVLSF
jgi:hypothetical protein